jgi:hypothetical protein
MKLCSDLDLVGTCVNLCEESILLSHKRSTSEYCGLEKIYLEILAETRFSAPEYEMVFGMLPAFLYVRMSV